MNVLAGINKEREIVSVVVPVIAVPSVALNAITDGLAEPPPEYCGMFKVAPTKVAAPLVPVVVKVIGSCTATFPLPSKEVEFTVLIFVPLTSAACLPLNVFQSVELNAPAVDVLAVAMLIAGVVPPLDAIGALPVTEVTPEPAAASIIS